MCPLIRVKFQVEEFPLSDDVEISLVQFLKYFQIDDKMYIFVNYFGKNPIIKDILQKSTVYGSYSNKCKSENLI